MFDLLYTSAILVVMSFALAREILQPSLIVFIALLLFLVGGVIAIDEAFIGFSNRGMITVGILFVVSAALQASGVFEKFITNLLGRNKQRQFVRYFRLLLPVAAFSAFLNNTPIVASLIPIIKNWAKRNELATSKFLIPVSYAAILGGTCTLIGTSTNLIIHGMMQESGFSGLSFFEITKIGVPVTLLSVIFLALFSDKLLPDRKSPVQQLGDSVREFVVAIKVGGDYPHIDKTIEAANLRHLQGLFLFQIIRDHKIIAPVEPTEKIQKGDRLFFTGLPETIYELQKMPGLNVLADETMDMKNIDSDNVHTYEAVISNNSSLVGQTVRRSQFRDRYEAVILAIHRAGSRVNKKIGDIIFQPNDTLFILGKKGFDQKYYHSKDFSLVSSSYEIFEKPKWKGNLALFFLLLMVIIAAANIVPIILAAAITAVLLVVFRIINVDDAKKSINLDVLLLIASSFGIAKALNNSGLASLVAKQMVILFNPLGTVGVFAGLYIAASLFTWIITNNAVAAILFPIALSIAKETGLEIRPIMLTLAMGASSSFVTPIGYQTNLMVYSPGGYRFTDFMRIGLLLNVVVGIISLLLISYFYL